MTTTASAADRFGIDGNAPWFPGRHNPHRRWNGWAVPRSALNTMHTIAESGTYPAVCISGDQVTVSPDDGDGESYIISPDLDGLYAFDGWSWIPQSDR